MWPDGARKRGLKGDRGGGSEDHDDKEKSKAFRCYKWGWGKKTVIWAIITRQSLSWIHMMLSSCSKSSRYTWVVGWALLLRLDVALKHNRGLSPITADGWPDSLPSLRTFHYRRVLHPAGWCPRSRCRSTRTSIVTWDKKGTNLFPIPNTTFILCFSSFLSFLFKPLGQAQLFS